MWDMYVFHKQKFNLCANDDDQFQHQSLNTTEREHEGRVTETTVDITTLIYGLRGIESLNAFTLKLCG